MDVAPASITGDGQAYVSISDKQGALIGRYNEQQNADGTWAITTMLIDPAVHSAASNNNSQNPSQGAAPVDTIAGIPISYTAGLSLGTSGATSITSNGIVTRNYAYGSVVVTPGYLEDSGQTGARILDTHGNIIASYLEHSNGDGTWGTSNGITITPANSSASNAAGTSASNSNSQSASPVSIITAPVDTIAGIPISATAGVSLGTSGATSITSNGIVTRNYANGSVIVTPSILTGNGKTGVAIRNKQGQLVASFYEYSNGDGSWSATGSSI